MMAFTGRCQRLTISEQLEKGVRCFDIRIRFDGDRLVVAHNRIEYVCSRYWLWLILDAINARGGCCVRMLHEVRTARQREKSSTELFAELCSLYERKFRAVRFFGGRNLMDWGTDYRFAGDEPTVEDAYGSRRKPRSLYALWPWLYAKLYNGRERQAVTDRDVKLMDFVEI